MNKHIKKLSMLLLLFATATMAGFAQLTFDTDDTKATYILTSRDEAIVAYNADMTSVAVMANCEYTVETDGSTWFNVIVEETGNLTIYADYYYDTTDRSGTVTLTSADGTCVRTLTVTQTANSAVETLEGDYQITIASGTATNYQSGAGIEYAFDGDYSTIFHSSWYNTTMPFTLTFTFEEASHVDYMVYTPRQSGTNGNFGDIIIYYQVSGSSNWITLGEYSLDESSSATTILFGDDGVDNVTAVRIVVNTAATDSSSYYFVSAAEIEFYSYNTELNDLLSTLFADDVYSVLADGVTADALDTISNEFVSQLVYQLLSGDYETEYRVATYPCLLSVTALADSWNVSGKYYDQFSGVTGISFAPGTYAVAVAGLPSDKSITLKIVAWYNGIVGDSFDGGDPQVVTYSLRNGLNTITYDPESSCTFADGDYIDDYNGLGYIVYDDDDDPDAYDDITVHFINGTINGYLSEDKTNDEMNTLLKDAPNKFMDVVSNKVHAVWTANGLYSYCKAAVNGSSSSTKGYLQYMHILDSLITWEQRLIGFEKYDRVPENRTFAYVNYTYYMFQGTYGTSYRYDQESRILNCYTLMYNDNDAIWGLSHEWGHQHQMTPFFCWTGMTEVTNNMNSYYNVMKMGYTYSAHAASWPEARNIFFNDTYAGTTSSIRAAAYAKRSTWSSVSDFYDLCTEMADSTIASVSEDVTRGCNTHEVGVLYTLCPLIMQFVYFTENGVPDFGPDMYEALRQTDLTDDSGTVVGSTVEKSDGVDKYELLAAAQRNSVSGAYSQFTSTYPNSVWTTGKYLTSRGYLNNSIPFVLNYIRKVSRITGYNMFPYFEKWGYLRVIATYFQDYSYGWHIFTQDAYDEFKEDMQALVDDGTLKEMDDDLIETISYTEDWYQDAPDIPNE